MKRIQLIAAASLAALGVLGGPAWAVRPLSVDSATTAAKGTGYVDAWVARQPGKDDTLNITPAYSPWEVLEVSVPLSRNRTDSVNSVGVLARVRITEPQKAGCNFLVALGHRDLRPGGNQSQAYTAASCNRNDFALHANLGAAKPSGTSSVGTWGVALEHDTGTFVAHVESFGQERSKPTFQLGARREVAKGWQVDGTLGRFNGETLFSLGVKLGF